ncbi:SDR family NAD(P)-dependent oxidoreductase [Paenibacillus sp. MBLB4367]|uniref:SDR family NAD(P)-dependent oxidoreductase n=1 Tax=Paenibacillus sp. MBLB4367 TaxID=3384767 RepID=UPI00390818F1
MRLHGKRVLISGGARGIGKGIARRFAEEGAYVYLLDKSERELADTCAELSQAYPGFIDGICCDVSDLEQMESCMTKAMNRWSGVDVLVNNAGIAIRESFVDISYEHWDTMMNINLRSMFVLSQMAAKQMIKQGSGGSIVNMSSKNGVMASSQLCHYNVSKGGVILLTQSTAVELASYGIRVNAVAPGFIETPMDRELKIKEGIDPSFISPRTPMKRMGTIEEVANVFLFLASDESSYVTGTTITVDGGHLANASEI